MLSLTKLDESYSLITGSKNELTKVYEFLKVERPGAYFETLVQRGFKSPFEYFAEPFQCGLRVLNGLIFMLEKFGIIEDQTSPEYSIEEISQFISDTKLPFELYDFQKSAVIHAITHKRALCKMCTGSGKSAVISMIAEFFRQHDKRGVLVVPNINLLTQFRNDILSYNLTDLYNEIEVLGDSNVPEFKTKLLISTWQSLIKFPDRLTFDYLICDESHRYSSNVSSTIISNSSYTLYKLGFTGTLPEDPVSKMFLLGLFGKPKTFITSSELIERGLGTPVKINSIIFQYPSNVLTKLRQSQYQQQLKQIKEYSPRNNFIINLTNRLAGNSLVLFSHTKHGKLLFTELMKLKYPDVEVSNKNITGKNSFEFQKQYHVYFLNGEDDSVTREKTRQIMESEDNAILISNYSILSTGVNMKKLHNMIFASPLKSYVTITQSIGRGLRKHESKNVFRVFDLVDDLGLRKPSGVFYREYQHRVKTSYNPEGFPISEKYFKL